MLANKHELSAGTILKKKNECKIKCKNAKKKRRTIFIAKKLYGKKNE